MADKDRKRRRDRDSGVGDSPEQAGRQQPPPPPEELPPARLEPIPEVSTHREGARYRSDSSDSDDQVGELHPPRVQVRPGGPLADPDLELAESLADLAVLPDPEVVVEPEPIDIDFHIENTMDAAQFQQFMNDFGTRMTAMVNAIPGPAGGGGGAGGAAGAQGGQIQSVITFSGEDSRDPKVWLSGIEMLATAYHWNDATIAQVAKSRCTDTANRWVNTQKILGLEMNYYVTHATDAANNPQAKGFRDQFLSRFKTTVQSVAATEALQNLSLKPNEDVRTFFDRIVSSIDTKNYTYTDDQKKDPAYIAGRNSDIAAFFSAGLPEDWRTLCQAGVPPANKEEWLERAVRIQAVKKDKHHNVSVVDSQQQQQQQQSGAAKNGNADKKDPIEELRKEVAALRFNRGRGGRGNRAGGRGGGRGRGRGAQGGNGSCYGCGEQGHHVLGCPHLPLEERIKKAEAFLARQKGRGGGRGRGTQGRGGRAGARNEHTYSIEDNDEEEEEYQGN